ncbi:DUF1768-domain-containing protein [Schizopora paradoxa]|uniref:DUF1768-domain-containing protein n=1 Tax=Schizopora paradoxa TaxID=27342 RepID=A0A0H2RCI3_9AGAM|nr:DUF1768-domain-containing protein [Schizopora paradoxa]
MSSFPSSIKKNSGYAPTQPPYPQSSRYKGTYPDSRRDCIYFYNKDEPHYGFTNFSPHPVVHEGKVYHTSEHLFQSFKFHPDRPLIAEHIRLCSDSPRTAFSEAQALKHLVRQDWASVKIDLMETAIWLKFSQNADLRDELLATGEAELFEDSSVDSFWGGGSDRQGRNELGKALMRVRTRFRAVLVSK